MSTPSRSNEMGPSTRPGAERGNSLGNYPSPNAAHSSGASSMKSSAPSSMNAASSSFAGLGESRSSSSPGVAAGTSGSSGQPGSSSSVGELLKELAREVPALLRSEVTLAKAEIRENAREAGKAAGAMATGGAIAQAGLVLLLAALTIGLSDGLDTHVGWAALIVGAVAALVGMSMVKGGQKKLENTELAPQRAMQSLAKDKDTVKGAMHEQQH